MNKTKKAFDAALMRGVRELLELSGLEKQAFASLCGFSPTVLSNVLAGRRPMPFHALIKASFDLGYQPKIMLPQNEFVFEKINTNRTT